MTIEAEQQSNGKDTNGEAKRTAVLLPDLRGLSDQQIAESVRSAIASVQTSPRDAAPPTHTLDGAPIPDHKAEAAVLCRGELRPSGDIRYLSIGDLAAMALAPTGAESVAFPSPEAATMRLAAIELKALTLALSAEDWAQGPGMVLDTEITVEEASLMLDAIANRLTAACELWDRMHRAGRKPESDGSELDEVQS